MLYKLYTNWLRELLSTFVFPIDLWNVGTSRISRKGGIMQKWGLWAPLPTMLLFINTLLNLNLSCQLVPWTFFRSESYLIDFGGSHCWICTVALRGVYTLHLQWSLVCLETLIQVSWDNRFVGCYMVYRTTFEIYRKEHHQLRFCWSLFYIIAY